MQVHTKDEFGPKGSGRTRWDVFRQLKPGDVALFECPDVNSYASLRRTMYDYITSARKRMRSMQVQRIDARTVQVRRVA